MKDIIKFLIILILFVLAGCGQTTPAKTNEEPLPNLTVVGFSQVGAESDWRNANTESMKTTITTENGYELIFVDGQQKQSNQITAIRQFIQQDVDYIVLAPVTETGWDTVLEEAKDAGIPVIIVDRMVNVKDDSLFTCFVGSDFELEAKKVTAWLGKYLSDEGFKASDVNIVNLQGNLGATAQIGRTKGLEDACEKYGWNLLSEIPADYTQAKAREVMNDLLFSFPEINVVYCENDNMALGAIEAIENAGKVAGPDINGGEILVLSFDGVSENALTCAKNGKILVIGECNPLHGPRVKALLEMLKLGMKPEKFSYVDETMFTVIDTISSVDVDGVTYNLTVLAPPVEKPENGEGDENGVPQEDISE